MQEYTANQMRAELESLRKRVAELEHALEVHEWGGQLFHESQLPQLLLDFETGAILCANEAARRFYGKSVLEREHIDCVCAEGLEWARDLKAMVAQQRYGVRVSLQHTCDDEIRTVETHYALINLRGRAVVHLIAFDITDKVRMQRELELSRDRYQAFIQLSSDAIWRSMLTEPIPIQLPVERQVELILERSYLAECNKAFLEIWGAAKESELIGMFMHQLFPTGDAQLYNAVRDFVLAGYRLSGLLYEAESPDFGRAYRYCSLQGIVHDGLLWGAWGATRDITELIKAQRALQQSEERYRTFVQYANEGIWRFDALQPIPINLPVEQQIERIFRHGYLAECNYAFARMYGLDKPEALIGMSLTELLVRDDEQNLEMLRAFIQNNYRVEGFVSKERAADGSERYFLNSFFGIVENGALVRAWGVCTDITELRRLQQQLDQAYRLESIGRLAGGIAHDFNNVLTAIIGFTELARGRIQDETALRYLDGVVQAAERAANLNRQLLAYARRQVMQLAPMDLGVWLHSVCDILRRVLPENIRIDIEVARRLWQIQGDPNLLLQILLNLVVNARDAMPQGGVIRVRLQNKTVRRARPSAVPNGSYVALTVADTGTGIPPDVLPHIFEPFFSTKPTGQGTGMGLAAVQGAVQQLGGYIELETEVGKGTRFTVYFPRLTSATSPRRTENTPME